MLKVECPLCQGSLCQGWRNCWAARGASFGVNLHIESVMRNLRRRTLARIIPSTASSKPTHEKHRGSTPGRHDQDVYSTGLAARCPWSDFQRQFQLNSARLITTERDGYFIGLRQHAVHNFPMHVRQPIPASLMFERQAFMVDAEQM